MTNLSNHVEHRQLGVYILLIYVVVSPILLILASVLTAHMYKHSTVSVDSDKNIVAHVGHVDMSNNDNLELLFEDKDNDISYYRRIDKSYVVEDESVYFSDDSVAKVVGTDAYGFYTEYIPSVVPGMSGTAVRNEDGEVVGYVEQILNNNIYCIWK